MAEYRVANIEFAVIDLNSASAQFDVERLDGSWTLVKSAQTSFATRTTAKEIAKAIGDIAKQIATKDSLINSVFADVIAILSGKVFEI